MFVDMREFGRGNGQEAPAPCHAASSSDFRRCQMTLMQKPAAVGSAPQTGRPAAGRQPPFELTDEEMALAVRFFTAHRRMEEEHAAEIASCLVETMEDIAEKHPRHVPRLRLVFLGAKRRPPRPK